MLYVVVVVVLMSNEVIFSSGVVLQIHEDDDESIFGLHFCDSVNIKTCHHHDDNHIGCQISRILKSNVKIIRMNCSQSRGPCWARHIGHSLWSVYLLLL